jgi:hypothetical protein
MASTMKNPWMKKNPAMSMFLSAANTWMGLARGQATSAMKRQITAATKTTTPSRKKPKRRT